MNEPGTLPRDWPHCGRTCGAIPSCQTASGRAGNSGDPQGLADAGDALLEAVAPRQGEDSQKLLAAEMDLRLKVGAAIKQLTLGEALERLIFEHLKDRALLVVDAAGLAAAGLTVDTPLSKLPLQADQPFWGLAPPVSCPSGIVLTTSRQQQDWQGIVSPRISTRPCRRRLLVGRDRQAGSFRPCRTGCCIPLI